MKCHVVQEKLDIEIHYGPGLVENSSWSSKRVERQNNGICQCRVEYTDIRQRGVEEAEKTLYTVVG